MPEIRAFPAYAGSTNYQRGRMQCAPTWLPHLLMAPRLLCGHRARKITPRDRPALTLSLRLRQNMLYGFYPSMRAQLGE